MVQTISRYETYKPSGIEWIGDVPKDWEIKRLKDVSEIIMGQSPDSNSYNDEEIGIPFFQGKVDFGDIHPIPRVWCSESTKISESGDILVSVRAPVGELNISIEKCCIGRGLTAIRVKRGCQKYAYYLLQIVNEELKINVTGSTFEAVSSNDVSILKWIYPPKSEQLAIANYLDDQTQKIDRLIANKKAQAEKLKELRQIEINNAVTKGIGSLSGVETPNSEMPASSKNEMKDSGIEWLGEIPKHWEVKRFKDISSMQSGESITSEDFLDDGEYPVYGGNGLRGYFGSYTHEGIYVLIGRQGALCGNINYASGKFWASEHAVVVSPKKKLDFFWLGELLRNMNLNQYSLASAQPGLSVEKILFLKVPFPPLKEQIQIANYLQQRTAAIDQLIKNIEAQIEKLQELRKIKIYEAVTGKIKVNGHE